MKFIISVTSFFLPVFVIIIIYISVYHQNYTFNRTECKSIYENEHCRQRRDIEKDPSYQWKFPIKYYVESPVDETNVKKAIDIISKNTCVNFTKSSYSFNNESGLIFKEGNGCSSYVGLISKKRPQEIFLTQRCWSKVPHILHEIGHALGLIHEHSRRDRDNYIDIYLNNVTTSEHGNFRKLENETYKNFSIGYDYHSIMHYHPKDFADNKSNDVITSKTFEPYNRMMGQRTKMTFNDFKQINLCYCDKCNWLDEHGKRNINYSKVNCTNGGYPDYNNCSRCICPSGFTGDNCTKIVSSDESCGNTTFHAKSHVQNLFFEDNKTCYIFLFADSKKKIDISVFYSQTPFKLMCTEKFGNEIKYRSDKGATGLLLCGWYSNYVNLTSESDSVLIIFRGVVKSNGMFLTFKEHNGTTKHKKLKSKTKNKSP